MAIEAGQRLLHYRLIEKIGEGGIARRGARAVWIGSTNGSLFMIQGTAFQFSVWELYNM